MNAKIKELLEKSAAIEAEMRTIGDKADAENRTMTAEEQTRWDAACTDIEAIDKQVEEARTAEEAEKRHKYLEARNKPQGRPSSRTVDGLGDTSERDNPANQNDRKCRAAWSRMLSGEISPVEYRAETRAMQADIPTTGGYLVAPISFQNELIKFMNNATFMRSISRTITLTGADEIQFPSWDTDPSDPTWTSEILTGAADTATAVGKRSLRPRPLAKSLLVSNTLMRKSSLPIDSLIQERLGYKAATTMENAFLNGTGSEQPLGVFTASANGIPTTQDVATDNTTTAITSDGLINCMFSLKAQYHSIGSWIFHRTAVRNIRKLKDGEGNYLWSRGIDTLYNGMPTILGRPVYMSEYAPSTFTAGLYVGIFGDFSKYFIVDSLTMSIRVLNELHAATDQTGFYLRAECDGMPVLSEAFARVTLAP